MGTIRFSSKPDGEDGSSGEDSDYDSEESDYDSEEEEEDGGSMMGGFGGQNFLRGI